ncbi:hypothetical protein P43SY_001892 [Pythium insidiosum]|uniref:PiggyBac transposable element-derived protein domain-containing protein n=1 Tax=Pythium insidiosum TaxID=114742 RepID=A0AAD5LC63_PYTIN|nr:hypothetical protein P43SY_001892 [Pythium insidiosum]
MSGRHFFHTHKLNRLLYSTYSNNRGVTKAENKTLATELIQHGVSRVKVYGTLLERGENVYQVDVDNLFNRERIAATSVEDRIATGRFLDQYSRDHDGCALSSYNSETHQTGVINISTFHMRSMFERFGELLMIDCTHKTNIYNYQLCTFMVMDEFGKGQPVHQSFFETNANWNMDRENMNEIRVLASRFPEARILICHFHVIKYLLEHCHKPNFGKLATADYKRLETILSDLVYSETRIKYEANYSELKSFCKRADFEDFLRYMDKNWDNCVDMWVITMLEGVSALISAAERAEHEHLLDSRVGTQTNSSYDHEMSLVLKFTTTFVAEEVENEYAAAKRKFETYSYAEGEDGQGDFGQWQRGTAPLPDVPRMKRVHQAFEPDDAEMPPVPSWDSRGRYNVAMRVAQKLCSELADVEDPDGFQDYLDSMDQLWRNVRERKHLMSPPSSPRRKMAKHGQNMDVDVPELSSPAAEPELSQANSLWCEDIGHVQVQDASKLALPKPTDVLVARDPVSPPPRNVLVARDQGSAFGAGVSKLALPALRGVLVARVPVSAAQADVPDALVQVSAECAESAQAPAVQVDVPVACVPVSAMRGEGVQASAMRAEFGPTFEGTLRFNSNVSSEGRPKLDRKAVASQIKEDRKLIRISMEGSKTHGQHTLRDLHDMMDATEPGLDRILDTLKTIPLMHEDCANKKPKLVAVTKPTVVSHDLMRLPDKLHQACVKLVKAIPNRVITVCTPSSTASVDAGEGKKVQVVRVVGVGDMTVEQVELMQWVATLEGKVAEGLEFVEWIDIDVLGSLAKTQLPAAEFVSQQIRNAYPFARLPGLLLTDVSYLTVYKLKKHDRLTDGIIRAFCERLQDAYLGVRYTDLLNLLDKPKDVMVLNVKCAGLEHFPNMRKNKAKCVTIHCIVFMIGKFDSDYARSSTEGAKIQLVRRLMAKHRLSVRRVTHRGKKTRDKMLQSASVFAAHIQYAIEETGVLARAGYDDKPAHVYNMDQTAVVIDISPNRTIDVIGIRDVDVVGSTSANAFRVSVSLCASALGRKLPPFIVYGGAPNGRIDEEVRQYNEKVVWCPDLDDSRVLLIDSYGVHKMDTVTSLLNDSNTQVEYIPPGMTGVCQPMDVAVMKVFKDQLRRSYLSYCIDNPLPATTAIRRALITQLVYDAWDAVPPQTILNGFVKCGILAIGPRDATGHFSVPQPTEGVVDEIVDVPDEIPDAASASDADEGFGQTETGVMINPERVIEDEGKSEDDRPRDEESTDAVAQLIDAEQDTSTRDEDATAVGNITESGAAASSCERNDDLEDNGGRDDEGDSDADGVSEGDDVESDNAACVDNDESDYVEDEKEGESDDREGGDESDSGDDSESPPPTSECPGSATATVLSDLNLVATPGDLRPDEFDVLESGDSESDDQDDMCNERDDGSSSTLDDIDWVSSEEGDEDDIDPGAAVCNLPETEYSKASRDKAGLRAMSTSGWETEGAVPAGTFGRFMSRNRFDQVMRSLHFTNNEDPRASTDRAWKIRSVVNCIQVTFARGYTTPPVLSFDEGILPSRSRFNPTRQYLKDKPHKWGTKLFVTCCASTAYCLRIGLPKAVLETKKTKPMDRKRGDVVMAVAKQFPMMTMLSWIDSKPVFFLSTARRINGEKKIVACPRCVVDYHRWMGGVDIHDQLRLQRYSLQLAFKFKKYYKSLFLGLLDIALTNAYIVWREHAKQQGQPIPAHDRFLELLQTQLLNVSTAELEGMSDGVATPQRAITPVRNKWVGHCMAECPDIYTSDKSDKRKTTKYFCDACSDGDRRVYLCAVPRHKSYGDAATCFSIWHDHWACGNDLPALAKTKRIQMRKPGKKRSQRQIFQDEDDE